VIADCCLNLDTLRFRAPFLGLRLESTYTIHLRLIGKRIVDFLLVLIVLQCVSKKTSPTFLAVTLESIVGFS